MKVVVITLSDRAYKGQYQEECLYKDESGGVIENILKKNFADIEVTRVLIPDEAEILLQNLEKYYQETDFILTTGGTGITKRDITPETCQAFCEKEIPGIAEILRLESYKETPNALLSRGYSGLKDKCIVVNFPGSPKACKLCVEILIPVMQHAKDLLC